MNECEQNSAHPADIAGLLGLSVKTVEPHRTRLMEKLDIRQTAGLLVRYAIRRGLIQP